MIQINLLPDVKATYVKAQRTKRSAVVLALIFSSISIGIVAILASIAFGTQAYQLGAVQDDIDSFEQQIKEVQDLDKILTIQNQLFEVNGLHDDKPEANRLFGFLQQTTPQDVGVDTYSVDFVESTITIEGNSERIEQINKYVDTIKFTQFSSEDLEEPILAFSDVVLSDFSKDDQEYTYVIDFSFDSNLFLGTDDSVQLIVTRQTTTRSETEQPTLFKPNANESEVE